MGEAYFYHLTRSAPEATVQALAVKSLAAGWRVAVRARSQGLLARLDDLLWLRPEDGFLPHGRAGGQHDAMQPVLLTTGPDAPNRADCVIALEGAEISAEEVRAQARVCILFDGNDEAALTQARGQWKALTGAGCGAQYWSEASGQWRNEHEKPAS
ncbi:MAG: DNA polymerase III subunit chi [Dinoroseobacter sp.]|nr:DNA polymerase III subunit chi [Dinoroseobacter sp.]